MSNRKFVLAITGGIGSGKSIISHCLRIMGIPVYDCDYEAKQLNNTHPDIRKALCSLIGNHVYQSDGLLNKSVLASFLFESPSHAEQINAIIHPIVKQHFTQWKEHQHSTWIGIESAILYESGFESLADKVVTVSTPEEVRIQRAVLRDHSSSEAIQRRIACQISDEERCNRAQYTIYNDGNRAVLPQILDILANLLCPSQK